MNNDWLRDVVRFFLDGLTLKIFVHLTIVFIVLMVLTPASWKELINTYNIDGTPRNSLYYTLLFCISFVFTQVMHSLCKFSMEKIKKIKRNAMFNSLSKREECYLCLALQCDDVIPLKRGCAESKYLMERGLLSRVGVSKYYPDHDDFIIPSSVFDECYIRLAGKHDDFIDEISKKH